MKNHLLAIGAIFAMWTLAKLASADTISLTNIGTAYTQDFNTLASSGTSSTLPTGWTFSESGTSANSTYTAGTGSANTGDTYSFGSSGSADRALGGIQSGTLIPMFGASFTNNTGSPITALTINYAGEQWRLGQANRGADKISFQYSLDAVANPPGTWTSVTALDFSSPITSGTVGALDGNASANHRSVGATIAVNIPIGGSFAIRWIDFNVTGADDGLAVDDFSLTPLTTTGTNIPNRYGPGALLATQTRPTDYGDNLNELDQLYARSDGNNLRLGITGNLQNNGNGIVILIDAAPGGSTAFGYSGSDASSRISGMSGDTLDSGFTPEFAIDTNIYDTSLFADLYDLQANTKTALGSVGLGKAPVYLAGGGEMSIDNSNTAGVLDEQWPGQWSVGRVENAGTATSGIEISLPLTRIGSPNGPLKVMVLLVGGDGSISNQILPGLPDTYGSLPQHAAAFNTYPGRQYVTITPAWTANDLAINQLPWTFEDRVFTGDSSLDNHPPVVNPPTIYNGRAYVVEDVEHYGGSHTGNLVALKTVDGTLDTTFGTNGRVALSGPATGRVTIRSVGGVVRLFVATSSGTLYSMDASNGGNLHSLSVGSSTSSSPAVMAGGATATIYIPVNTAGSWHLKQVTDTASMTETGNLNLVGVTNVSSSPSVIADGTRIQLGCVTSSGGVVYTISSDLSTVFNGAVTANPVTASPTLASDSLTFYVGDAPSSGNGAFYCFNASTGSQVATTPISGGLEYAPFGDYSLGGITNALYFATNTGQLNAVNPSTLSPLTGYPATPMGLEPAAGAVVLFNGKLYVPTAKGMYAVPSAAPTSFARFPIEGQASTPSSAGRVTGSVMATTLASGLVGGLTVQ